MTLLVCFSNVGWTYDNPWRDLCYFSQLSGMLPGGCHIYETPPIVPHFCYVYFMNLVTFGVFRLLLIKYNSSSLIPSTASNMLLRGYFRQSCHFVFLSWCDLSDRSLIFGLFWFVTFCIVILITLTVCLVTVYIKMLDCYVPVHNILTIVNFILMYYFQANFTVAFANPFLHEIFFTQ